MSGEGDTPAPVTYRGTVYPWHCDHVGHMNVMWYVGKFDEATWHLFARFGVTSAFLRDNGSGMAAVQQNITYARELLPGDIVTVRSRLLELREKAVRFRHDMTDETTGETAAVCELTAVHMDTATRKACPFPEEIAARARALVSDPAG